MREREVGNGVGRREGAGELQASIVGALQACLSESCVMGLCRVQQPWSGGCAAALPKPQRPSRYLGSERAPSAAPLCAAAREFR